MKFPHMASKVFTTPKGVRYLKCPGVALIGQTSSNLSGIEDFLGGFDQELDFEEYLDDPTVLPDAERLIKFAGQLCYLSLDPKKSTSNSDASKYFTNIKSSSHGSVFEHASFSFLCYGIDRAVTHELVRHRSGMAFSQVSQRYVSGSTLRFVERLEYQDDPELHAMFEKWIEASAEQYDLRADVLMRRQQEGAGILYGEKARDLRKKVNQAARACLPNETEAPIVVSANVRALRHVMEMRADSAADIAIRSLAYKFYECVVEAAPRLFDDYTRHELPDGVPGLKTPYRKV